MDSTLQLRRLSEDNVFEIMALQTAEGQESAVVPHDRQVQYVRRYATQSLAEAALQPGSWVRAMYSGDDPVGFVWVQPSGDEILLRRLLVDGRHQRCGHASTALQMLLDEFPHAETIQLQCLPEPHGPEGFFRKLGFVASGQRVGEEIVMRRFRRPVLADKEATVTLRPVTPQNLVYICDLEADGPVAPNGVSVVEAHLLEGAYLRAIYADEVPVGLIMMHEDHSEEEPEFFLWRLGVDARYQRRGFGARALGLLIEYAKHRGAVEMLTSCDPPPGGPLGFYTRLGFEDTGDWIDDEMLLKRRL